MGAELSRHRAGEPIVVAANDLFRRTTDRYIQRYYGKTPLDVGADRIARTAHAALRFLSDVASARGERIPMAWSSHDLAPVSVIEVYPAATLVALQCRSTSYKRSDQREERRQIARVLARFLTLGQCQSRLEEEADALDAAVCVLAGVDFLEDRSPCPVKRLPAEQEGWIWVRTVADSESRADVDSAHDVARRISIDPAICGGKPCIIGTRITVYDVLEYLAGGMTEDEILSDFPDLAREDIHAVLAFVAARERRPVDSGA
jgi:uncharacterized protein (DUF433 family)